MVEDILKDVDSETKKKLFFYLLDEFEDVLIGEKMLKMRQQEPIESISEEEFFNS